MFEFGLKGFDKLMQVKEEKNIDIRLVVFGYRYGMDTFFDCGWTIQDDQETSRIRGSIYPTTDLSHLYDLIGYAIKSAVSKGCKSSISVYFCDEENTLFSPSKKSFCIKDFNKLTLLDNSLFDTTDVYYKALYGRKDEVYYETV